ncbi:hypothetical protein MUK42_23081 [Musa troglodytarum]|uniref:Uncharacterized protein n=1 Tax=Musa troglodytarum TaxID=320322 RepID=A0A9E7KAG4_9LILI|nr:hypothetical protein MUK42_23081 [Musa troglodytarum]
MKVFHFLLFHASFSFPKYILIFNLILFYDDRPLIKRIDFDFISS